MNLRGPRASNASQISAADGGSQSPRSRKHRSGTAVGRFPDDKHKLSTPLRGNVSVHQQTGATQQQFHGCPASSFAPAAPRPAEKVTRCPWPSQRFFPPGPWGRTHRGDDGRGISKSPAPLPRGGTSRPKGVERGRRQARKRVLLQRKHRQPSPNLQKADVCSPSKHLQYTEVNKVKRIQNSDSQ